MMYNVFKIIDKIESLSIKKRLDELKLIISSDSNKKKLIDNLNIAKANYEKYNIKEDFIKAKRDLFKDEVISEYLKIQNEINMLSIYINKKFKDITNDN